MSKLKLAMSRLFYYLVLTEREMDILERALAVYQFDQSLEDDVSGYEIETIEQKMRDAGWKFK
jgi:hypothetical protein